MTRATEEQSAILRIPCGIKFHFLLVLVKVQFQFRLLLSGENCLGSREAWKYSVFSFALLIIESSMAHCLNKSVENELRSLPGNNVRLLFIVNAINMYK